MGTLRCFSARRAHRAGSAVGAAVERVKVKEQDRSPKPERRATQDQQHDHKSTGSHGRSAIADSQAHVRQKGEHRAWTDHVEQIKTRAVIHARHLSGHADVCLHQVDDKTHDDQTTVGSGHELMEANLMHGTGDGI